MNRTNHFHINRMLTLLENETHPFRKIHRLIDTFETILKTYTAVITGTLFKNVNVPEELKGLLAEALQTPSLGTWQYISVETIKAMKGNEFQFPIDNFYKTFEEFNKKYCSGDMKDGSVNFISLRNGYAHGATPPDDKCIKDIEKYLPHLYDMITAEWFNTTAIISFRQPESGRIPVMMDGYHFDFKSNLGSVMENISVDKEVKPLYPYLVTLQSEMINLFPILTITGIDDNEYSITFFNDLRKKKSVSLLNYPSSLHISDKDMYAELISVIPVEEWRNRTVSLFKDRIDELTEVFKGRKSERQKIHDFIINEERGFLAVTGNPGIGKSALIAQAFRELPGLLGKKKYYLVEYFVRRGTFHARPDSMIGYLNRKIEEAVKTGIPTGGDLAEQYSKLHERLSAASEKLNDEKLVIFIDGLDEGKDEGINLFQYLIGDTYRNILVVYGSRSTADFESFYNRLPVEYKRKHEISGLSGADIRAMLYDYVNKYELKQEYVNAVAERSGGNPLYLKLLCDALERNELTLNDVNSLPVAVGDLYRGIVERYSKLLDGAFVLRALYTLGASRDYLTQKQFEIILGIDEALSEKVVMELLEVLQENPDSAVNSYQLFHESFREYLWTEKRDSMVEAELRIVDYCRGWSSYTIYGGEVEIYPMTHFTYHLFKRGLNDELFSLADNRDYINRQVYVTGQYWPGLELFQQGMKAAEGNTGKLIDLAIGCLRLHNEAAGDWRQIVKWSETGGMENIENALRRVEMFTGYQQFYMYMIMLHHALLGKNREKSDKKDSADAILRHFDQNVTGDTEILDWADIVPGNLMLMMMYEIRKLDLDISPLLIRSKKPGLKEIVKGITDLDDLHYEILFEMAEMVDGNFKSWSAFKELGGRLAGNLKTDNAGMILTIIGKANNHAKSWLLSALTEALSNSGDINLALEFLFSIKDDDEKRLALHEIIKFLAVKGEIERALTIASEIKDIENNAVCLIDIVRVLAKSGEIERALKIASDIKDEKNKTSALCYVAETLGEAGEITKALELLLEIEDEEEKTSTLRDIAGELIKSGDMDKAGIITEKISDSDIRSELLTLLAESFAKSGNIEPALKIAERVEYSDQESLIFKAVALSLIESGDINRGIDIAGRIYDRDIKIETLCMSAVNLFNSEKEFKANMLLYKAFKIALSIDDVDSKIRILCQIAEYSAICKYIDAFFLFLKKAVKFANKIISEEYSDSVCDIISESFVPILELENRDKLLKKVFKLANTFHKQSNKEIFLKNISLKYTEAGEIDCALEIADKIGDEFYKNWVLWEIAKSLVEAGNIDRADEITCMITDSDKKNEAYSNFAESLATAGEIDSAVNYADMVYNVKYKSRALLAIVENLMKVGDLDQAGDLASAIEDNKYKNRAFKHILNFFVINNLIDSIPLALEKYIMGIDTVFSLELDSEFLKKIVSKLGDSEQFERLIEICEIFPSTSSYYSLIYEEAKAHLFANSGQFDKAIKFTDTIDDEDNKINSLNIIAKRAAYSGDRGKAFKLWKKAEELTDRSKDNIDKYNNYTGIAANIAFYGYKKSALVIWDKALKAALKIDGDHKPVYLKWLAGSIADSGEINRAYEVWDLSIDAANKINDTEKRFYSFKYIVSSFASAGEKERGVFLCEKMVNDAADITEAESRALVYNTIAESFAKTDRIDKALELWEKSIKSAYEIGDWLYADAKYKVLIEITGTLAKYGQVEKALYIADGIDFAPRKVEILKAIVESLAESDNVKLAVSIISSSGITYASIIEGMSEIVNAIKSEEGLIIFQKELDQIEFPSEIESPSYGFILDKLTEIYTAIPSLLPSVIGNITSSRGNLGKALFAWALHLWINRENLSQLRRISSVIDIKWMTDSIDASAAKRTFGNLAEWIGSVSDEDDRDQIELWAKKVEKGKMTPAEFDKRVGEFK